MLIIDSQIWIYYYDINSLEHDNVKKWMEGEKNDGVLFSSKIAINAIIPIEIANNLYGMRKMEKNLIEKLVINLISLKNSEFTEINQNLIFEALRILKKFRLKGIGGREALILATMINYPIKTIATNDTNILAITDIKRIDPIFDPPLVLDIGKIFGKEEYKQRIKGN